MLQLVHSFLELGPVWWIGVQLGWLGVPYIGSPVGSVWLGTRRMKDLGGSWTRMISMLFLLFSNMVFIRVLFFLTFCENIFKVSLIMVSYYLQLGELSWPWFSRLPVLFLNASPYWIDFSRRGICSRQPYVRLCNWCIWRSEDKAGLVQFQVSVTPYKTLGKLSDILHLNNRNNQLERRAQPPRNVPLDA